MAPSMYNEMIIRKVLGTHDDNLIKRIHAWVDSPDEKTDDKEIVNWAITNIPIIRKKYEYDFIESKKYFVAPWYIGGIFTLFCSPEIGCIEIVFPALCISFLGAVIYHGKNRNIEMKYETDCPKTMIKRLYKHYEQKYAK